MRSTDVNAVMTLYYKGNTYQQIADVLKTTRGTVAGIIRDYRGQSAVKALSLYPHDTTYTWGVDEPVDGAIADFNGHPTLEGDAVVISDIHAPFVDQQLCETVNKAGRYYGVDHLIIAGDLFDGNSQSVFRRKVRTVPFETEMAVVEKLLGFWADQFKTISVFPGNHDDWFLKNLSGEVSFARLMRMVTPEKYRHVIKVYQYDRVVLVSQDQQWIIPHQLEASSISLKVAEKLALKFEMNVLSPHQHNTAWGYTFNGKYIIADIGGLHNSHQFAYTNLRTTTSPVPDKGYAVIIDGGMELISPDIRCLAYRRLLNE